MFSHEQFWVRTYRDFFYSSTLRQQIALQQLKVVILTVR